MLKTLIHTDLHMFYSILFNLRKSAKSVVKNRKYNSHFFAKQSQSIRYAYCVPSTSLRTRMRIAKGI